MLENISSLLQLILTPVSWLIGFVSAITVILLTESYKDKKDDKKRKLRRLDDLTFYIRECRNEFENIMATEGLKIATTSIFEWGADTKAHYDRIQAESSLVYGEDLIENADYGRLLVLSKSLFMLSLMMRKYSLDAGDLRDIGHRMTTIIQELSNIEEVLSGITRGLDNKKIWRFFALLIVFVIGFRLDEIFG